MAFLIGRYKKFLWIAARCELFQSLDGQRKKNHGLQCAALEGYGEVYGRVRAC